MIKIVEIPKELYHILEKTANQSKAEKCGILIGYHHKNKIVITHIIENKTAEDQSSVGVTRVMKDIWSELNLIARDFSPSDYIGEWHTHPSGLNIPSFIDILSMVSILDSQDYGYLEDVILIIGILKKGLKCWNFSKDGYSSVSLQNIADDKKT